MPTDRFYALKPVKKRAVLKEAYKEFALHDYESASITQLVKSLKMAKGSIYQYFDDKEELYNYLLAHAEEQLNALVTKACPHVKTKSHLEDLLLELLMVQVKFFCALPAYALLFIKYNTQRQRNTLLPNFEELITKAFENHAAELSGEALFILQNLPLLVFQYYITNTQLDVDEIIRTDGDIKIPSNKLVYLCQSFLKLSI